MKKSIRKISSLVYKKGYQTVFIYIIYFIIRFIGT